MTYSTSHATLSVFWIQQMYNVCLYVCIMLQVTSCWKVFVPYYILVVLTKLETEHVEIKCQLDATEVCRMLQHPANLTHNLQLHTRPTT